MKSSKLFRKLKKLLKKYKIYIVVVGGTLIVGTVTLLANVRSQKIKLSKDDEDKLSKDDEDKVDAAGFSFLKLFESPTHFKTFYIDKGTTYYQKKNTNEVESQFEMIKRLELDES